MYNEVITLISIIETIDDIGDTVVVETEKDVFAQVRSIGMREKYEAFSVGLKPELTFVLADYFDYSEEPYIKYNDIKYTVLRTYKKDTNELEIVVTR